MWSRHLLFPAVAGRDHNHVQIGKHKNPLPGPTIRKIEGAGRIELAQVAITRRAYKVPDGAFGCCYPIGGHDLLAVPLALTQVEIAKLSHSCGVVIKRL